MLNVHACAWLARIEMSSCQDVSDAKTPDAEDGLLTIVCRMRKALGPLDVSLRWLVP